MENSTKISQYKFVNFLIQESQITRKPVERAKNFDIQIDVFGIIIKSKRQFQLDMIVTVSEETKRFHAKVHAVGLFEFKEDTNKQDLDNYFYINSPALIFPYVRAYIASLTALSGMEAINLPPLNVSNLVEKLKQNTEEKD